MKYFECMKTLSMRRVLTESSPPASGSYFFSEGVPDLRAEAEWGHGV